MSKRSGITSGSKKSTKSVSKKVDKHIEEDYYSDDSEEIIEEFEQDEDSDKILDINDIAIKKIDKDVKFYYGRYGDFKVIFMTKNGYINVSRICEYAGEHLYNWNARKDSKAMKVTFASMIGIINNIYINLSLIDILLNHE